jgi:hypothetical protein
METGLAKYDAMVYAIAECHQVDEAKDIRDKARAMEVYASLAMNFDAERQAADIRIRAEVKTGELLSGSDKAKNQHLSAGSATRPAQTLSDMGIKKDQSSKWQKMAAIPEKEREGYLAQPGIPSTEGMIRAHELKQNPPPVMPDFSEKALWIWGKLREAESNKMFEEDLNGLIFSMTTSMQKDMHRLVPQLKKWIDTHEQ